MQFPMDKQQLADMGLLLTEEFCDANRLPVPHTDQVPAEEWHVGACAYYRAGQVKICLEHCGFPCSDMAGRNWTWPGSITDREPYGVLAHELGHHADLSMAGELSYRGLYWSDYGRSVMKDSGEKPVSGYCPNPAEWFAEVFRLFVTNPDLLRRCRPRTYQILLQRWQPVVSVPWDEAMGDNVPERVLRTNRKKMVWNPEQTTYGLLF